MNVTEFAERVVFGTTLEDKLTPPGKLAHDTNPRFRSIDELKAPCRPVGMEMNCESGKNLQPPADHQLENEQARGQLLHFLANHELLATELMALVLLKFPDAPHAFRQGVLVTLQEEQHHTQMYIQRMQECGVEFGAFPLSGQFWRIVEPMKSPMDFVSRLSLTFEQANLDYSLHFARVFDRMGDQETAKILQQIYQDEITHVKHGLDWFRKWKDPNQSDWEAYEQSLHFPMSPQRGRGPLDAFNREGRKRAGLTDDFIDAIEVFRQSKGRMPTVRWFDAGVESELAGSQDGLDPRESNLVAQLSQDLEWAMLTLSKQDDVLLVRKLPDPKRLRLWSENGIELPEFLAMEDRMKLGERKLSHFEPWAWTKRNVELVQPLVAAASTPIPKAESINTNLFRKSWAAQRLGDWTAAEGLSAFGRHTFRSVCISDFSSFNEAMKFFASSKVETVLLKHDLGTSGRGQRRFSTLEITEQDRAWLKTFFSRCFQESPLAIVEPYYKRVLDLSFLWGPSRDDSEQPFLGWTRPLVTEGRRYTGTRLGKPFSNCDSNLRRFLARDRFAILNQTAEWLHEHLVAELSRVSYSGPLGVDAMVIENEDQSFSIKPIVEVNPRFTMGHLAKSLERRLAPGVVGEFRVLSKPEWQQFKNEAPEPGMQFKPNAGTKKWTGGWLPLGPANQDSKLIPVVIVGDLVHQPFR